MNRQDQINRIRQAQAKKDPFDAVERAFSNPFKTLMVGAAISLMFWLVIIFAVVVAVKVIL